jgi:hypothetical protein
MRMFADRVMPVLQRDAAFASPSTGAAADVPVPSSPTGIFAPA